MWKTERVYIPMGELPEVCINKELTLIENHFIIDNVTLSFQDRSAYITYKIIDYKPTKVE